VAGSEALVINAERSLDKLKDLLEGKLGRTASTERWNEDKKEFLHLLPGLLTARSEPEFVPRREMIQLKEELDRGRAAQSVAESQIAHLREENAALAKLKDAEEVIAIAARRDSDVKSFEALLKEARECLKPLRSVTRKVLFARLSGDDYVMDDDESQADVNDQMNRKYIVEGSGTLELGDAAPVKSALAALSRLDVFVEKPPGQDFHSWYETHHGGVPLDLKNLDFWDAHLR
jgi:hypothetical protein